MTTTPTDPLIGQAFRIRSSTYVLIELISEGGFGKVYRARRKKPRPLSRQYAVKVPANHVLEDEIWLKKFRREARILANIDHPNVVSIVGLLELDNGTPLLVQEFIEDAKEFCDHHGASDADMLSMTLQVLYGLRETHGTSEEARAIHRDLSPRNVLITPRGRAKIIDFGLAKEDPR